MLELDYESYAELEQAKQNKTEMSALRKVRANETQTGRE